MAEQTKIIRPQAGFQEKFVRSNIDVVIGGGVLNPQPLESRIMTPNGYILMKDIKAGDVICDTKGGTQKVNYVLDKGIQPCVEFTLSDGRKVKSALSHNWKVKECHGKTIEVTAQDIIDYIDLEKEKAKYRNPQRTNRYRIPVCSPCYIEDTKKEQRKLHPYLVGYLLGNGCISDKANTMYFRSIDDDVVNRISELGYTLVKKYEEEKAPRYEFRGKGFKQLVKDAGIYGMVSYNKRIPNAYKYACLEDRLELLRGLFDSDGCCEARSGQVSYKSVSLDLIHDIQEMIYALGGIANYTTKEPKDMYIRNTICKCRVSYELRVRTKIDKELFFLPRKKQYAKTEEEHRQKLYIGIESYRILEPCEMRCINVDNEEHLYLTDNYVMTCNCGKTSGAVLMCAEPSLDPNFRGVFLRNNLGDLRSGGGILDEFKKMYHGTGISVVESGEPRVEFTSGARIDVTHIADQTREKVRQRFKGRQYDLIYFDEMTGFSFECFCEVCTRNRGIGEWTGKIRGTTNPDRNHWLRKFLDWYIGADGFIIPERDGVVRYFFMNGETVNDVVWGDTKKEVYQKCKVTIDRQLAKVNGTSGSATYEDLIRSFTFYLGKISENKASLGGNKGYVGAVAMSGGRNAQQLLEGNWNVSPSEDENAPIPSDVANEVFMNDPQRNGDKWVTCDLADTGTDNFLAIAWNGFHIEDILILGQTTPRMNAERLQMFAADHNIADSHIIYDAIRGTYINDYIPDAIPFVSYRQPIGLYGRAAYNLKAECYLRLVEAIKRGYLSFDDRIANKIYEHQKLKENITIQAEFMEECSVVRFKDMPSGKKALLSKKEMNAKLGKDRSMDLLDPCAMRFFACLDYPYGEELERTAGLMDEDDDDKKGDTDIYDEGFWA